jgi:hypothetical protein
VTAIDGEGLTSTGAAIAVLELHSVPGDTLTLTSAESGGVRRNIQVTVGSRPIMADLQAAPPQ